MGWEGRRHDGGGDGGQRRSPLRGDMHLAPDFFKEMLVAEFEHGVLEFA